MARAKSLVARIEVDEALRSHNCQHSRAHRVMKGDKRLKVREGRSWEHYCLECAERFLVQSIERLGQVLKDVREARSGG